MTHAGRIYRGGEDSVMPKIQAMRTVLELAEDSARNASGKPELSL